MSDPIELAMHYVGKNIRLAAKTQKGLVLAEEGICQAITVFLAETGSISKAVRINNSWFGISHANEPDPDSPTPWVITGVDL